MSRTKSAKCFPALLLFFPPLAGAAVQSSDDRIGPIQVARTGEPSGIGTVYLSPQALMLDGHGVPFVYEGAQIMSEWHLGTERVLWGNQVLPFGDTTGVLFRPRFSFPTETARWTYGVSLDPLFPDLGITSLFMFSPVSGVWPMLLRNERPVLWYGKPTTGAPFAAGTYWMGQGEFSAGNDNAGLTWTGWMDPATGQIRSGLVLFRFDEFGGIVSEELIVERNQPGPSGMGVVAGFTDLDLSSDERMALSISTTVATGAWVDGQFVLVLGDPGPVPGETISDVWHVAVNRHGDWAVGCDLNTGGYAIYKNGQVLVHGDTHFGPGRKMLNIREVSINDRGDVVYAYALDDLTTHIGMNGASVLSSRDEVDGQPVFELRRTWDAVADRQGRQIFAAGLLVTPFLESFGAAITLDLSSPICAGVSTSAGVVPDIGVFRSERAESERASVHAKGLPPLAQTLLVSGRVQANLPGAGGAIGTLCISPAIRSLPKQVEPDGTVEHFIRPSLAATGAAPPEVGERWLFQLWYRDVDPSSGAPVSRFTEAVEMTFE